MNIFALSKDPIESAQQMLNKHVVKMPTETCQMLHTNALFMEYTDRHGQEPTLRQLKEYHALMDSNLMKPAMLNHPSTIWARQSIHNTLWLYNHGMALCEEYTERYGKEHGSFNRMLQTPIEFDADTTLATPVLIAMADEYRLDRDVFYNTARVQYGIEYDEWDFVIESYRHYYLEGKWKFAEWPEGKMPDWWPKNHYAVKYNKGVRAYNATKPKYPMLLLEE